MDPIDRRLMLGAAGLAGVAAFSKLANAGPLEPPKGPIAPTGRTTDELYSRIARTEVGVAEPRIPVQSLPASASALYVISQPGSYYLTGNVQGVAGKNGIEITSRNVAIDLCGYTIQGSAEGTLKGIALAADGEHISIRNGCVIGWRQGGVNLYRDPPGVARYFLLTRLHVADCAGDGIRVGESAQVSDCVVSRNTGDGIRGEQRTSISNCVADSNGGRGLTVFVAGSVARSVAARSGTGIEVTYSGNVEDCGVADCNYGIISYGDSVVRKCAVSGSGTGITAYFGKALIEENNIASASTGIVAGKGCLVRGNNVSADFPTPGPGIRTDGVQSGLRIDENHVENYDVAIQVQGTRNVITRNTARNGSNPYAIDAGNTYGPIVNAVGIGALGGSGNQNHPWANFVY